ncbi:hypothetical protein NE237_022583 [Protea cynaroides]|uniref:Uncharacterized protein n=1 Tax=Protea cynaroides TaxID=273540 RepID=A0A9Q0K3P3_9MAGN|nr:hypothetical protein NE237_022583 [Protea cynaroides]
MVVEARAEAEVRAEVLMNEGPKKILNGKDSDIHRIQRRRWWRRQVQRRRYWDTQKLSLMSGLPASSSAANSLQENPGNQSRWKPKRFPFSDFTEIPLRLENSEL